MLRTSAEVYRLTRKKHDQLFNTYFMRPIAAVAVALCAKTPATPNQLTLVNLAVFVAAMVVLIAAPSYGGGLAAIAVLELSYLFDCADGMLARYKKLASKEGHLFDFFTDEIKATLLVAALGVRLWRAGGLGIDATVWPPERAEALLATVLGVVIVASALSLTNFVRRPELTGKDTPVESHYETVEQRTPTSPIGKAAALLTTFLRFLNHYPSHIWAFAIAGRLEIYFWIYILNNLLYLGRGWLGLVLRFGLPRGGRPASQKTGDLSAPRA